jgi:hypothetical protein
MYHGLMLFQLLGGLTLQLCIARSQQ